jgi:hypothetical protein
LETLLNDLLKQSPRFQALCHQACPESLIGLLRISVKGDESIFKLRKVLVDAQKLLELVALFDFRYQGQLLEVGLQGFASIFYQGGPLYLRYRV